MNLNELKAAILEDGVIDASEVEQIRKVVYSDGKIDREEADFLFELNDECSSSSNDNSWQIFFVDTICDFLLKDENSPGTIDEDEANWLISKIDKDGTVDSTEQALLSALKSRSKSIPGILTDFINKSI